MMHTKQELQSLDLPALSNLYSQQIEALNSKLLAGADWESLNELRGLTLISVWLLM